MAAWPGSTAITAAAASQPAAITASKASGTATTGVMPSWCAKTCQLSLPHAIPAGTPITRAIPASVSACQHSVPRTCHEVKPSAARLRSRAAAAPR